MTDLVNLIATVFRLERRAAHGLRKSVITDVKDGKYRFQIGMKPDGTPHKGPWIFPGQHNGIKREDVPFRVGQNIWIHAPTGDWRSAQVTPYGPNDDNPRPIHANATDHTTQYPHIDKDNKEEKDKDKPGYQRTESSKERTSVFDKISTSTLTKDNHLAKLIDKVGGKIKSETEQTAKLTRRLLDNGTIKSILEHAAERVFHQVGDQVSHLQNAQGFLRKVQDSLLSHGPQQFLHKIGDLSSLSQGPAGFIRLVGSSMMSHGPAQILHSLGNVQQLISGGGILASMGGVSSLLSSAGQIFTGGNVSHNGVNIGGTHTHQIPGPFGMILSMVPQLLGGGGGGSPPSPPPPGTGGGMGPPSSLDLMSASTPFAPGVRNAACMCRPVKAGLPNWSAGASSKSYSVAPGSGFQKK